MRLPDIFKKKFSKEDAARLLQIKPEALAAFEKAYEIASLNEEEKNDNFFKINSRQAVKTIQNNHNTSENVAQITDKIVNELLSISNQKALPDNTTPVTNTEIKQLPEELRPQLTGHLMKVDINSPSYIPVLDMLANYQKTGDKMFYHMFRQGLDTLDLDPVTYQIIGMNKNSIGYWFPALKNAAEKQDFFKIPATTIVKVPLPLLQLAHTDYFELTPTTIDIVNKWAYEAFHLDENKTYFVKTGTYSSKFDFRNAKVTTPKEVRELGSYLLFIHFQALQMASPLSKPCIYGASTTNEWCVREYIEDKENNPCIYHGMPLHTEYRVFVDFDTDEILGIAPYWEPDTMKKRFSKEDDADTPDMTHDYVIYLAHEKTLMDRYHANKDIVIEKLKDMIPNVQLSGQWSLDIMQNGNDFWLIDMGEACTSALKEYIPEGKLKPLTENWIPKLPNA